MRDRRLLTLDEVEIKRAAAVFRERIIKSLGVSASP